MTKILLSEEANLLKEYLKDIYMYFNSPKITNPTMPTPTKSIIFVCKGNICRSPFAEQIAKKICLDQNFRGKTFFSAGLEVSNPLSPPDEVLSIAKEFKINLLGHKSIRFTKGMAESYDMIVAMETWQAKLLREMIPEYYDKIFLLSHFENNPHRRLWSYAGYNIIDPYGRSMPYYYECFRRIKGCVDTLLNIIS